MLVTGRDASPRRPGVCGRRVRRTCPPLVTPWQIPLLQGDGTREPQEVRALHGLGGSLDKWSKVEWNYFLLFTCQTTKASCTIFAYGQQHVSALLSAAHGSGVSILQLIHISRAVLESGHLSLWSYTEERRYGVWCTYLWRWSPG
jgi:hypothetical protein